MKALILAAGRGTRLRYLTQNRPKPLLPVGGTPLLEHTMRWLKRYGITEIAINLHHCASAITQKIGDGAHLGVNVHYSYEDRLLGTAGAAKRLQTFLDERFVVVYGDVTTNMHLGRLIHFHNHLNSMAAPQAALTMALYRVPNPTECGLVDLSPAGYVQRFVEKPPAAQVSTNIAFSGIMVCEPEVLHQIPAEQEFDFGQDLFPSLLAAKMLFGGLEIGTDEFMIDIGTLNGYLRALRTWALLPVRVAG